MQQTARSQSLDLRCGGETLIPGTHIVADVASERPPVQLGYHLVRNGAAVLDVEIRNAAGRIQQPRRQNRFGGARVETLGAATALIKGEGRIDRKREIGHDRADEKERS